MRISGSNAGYTMFRGSVKCTGYPLHSPVSPLLPLPCVTVCHHFSAGVYDTLASQEITLFPVFCRSNSPVVPRVAASVRLATMHERGAVHGRLEQVYLRLYRHQLYRAHLRQRYVHHLCLLCPGYSAKACYSVLMYIVIFVST